MTTVGEKNVNSIKERILLNLLHDETFHDVELIGSDGAKVPACRMVLAAGSDYFKTMFCGSFNETQKDVIKIQNFTGAILHRIVQYMHTGEIPTIWENNIQASNKTAKERGQLVQYLLKICEAATFFMLPELSQPLDVKQQWIKADPNLSIWLLPHCSLVGNETWSLVWSNIRNKEHVVTDDAVQMLPASAVELVLQDEDLCIDEIHVFHMLQKWYKYDKLNRGKDALKMAKHLWLELIDPVQLAGAVTESGLVLESDLLKAFKQYALFRREQDGKKREDQRQMKTARKARKFFVVMKNLL